MSGVKAAFDRDGFVGPVRLVAADETAALAKALATSPAPDTWLKGCAVTSERWFELATRPEIADRVAALLGDDVMLCGANLVERDPDQVHPWHTDVHVAHPAGRAVTVWLGLTNVSAETSLQVVPGSHRYGFCPQQRAAETANASEPTSAPTSDDALRWAREADPDAATATVEMTDGEAVFFDGNLWHGTHHRSDASTRVAVLLHYATPDKPVRLHGPGHVWPFEMVEDPLPPCQMIRGRSVPGVNRLVPAPGRSLSTHAAFDPTVGDGPPDWKPDPAYFGPTRGLDHLMLKVHAVGDNEHDAHRHDDEQIIVALRGTGTLLHGPAADDLAAVDLPIGSVAYLPPGHWHTATASEESPAGSTEGHVQLDIAWRGRPRAAAQQQPTQQQPAQQPATQQPAAQLPATQARVLRPLDHEPNEAELADRGRSAVELWAGPTATIDRLRILRVDLDPGFVGLPDTDAYDVVLVVQAGAIEVSMTGEDQRRAGVGDVVFFGAGEPHRLRTHGTTPARLLVIELHAGTRPTGRSDRVRAARRFVTSRLPRPVRLAVRRLRRMVADRMT